MGPPTSSGRNIFFYMRDAEGWKWRRDPQDEFHDGDPWGSMKRDKRAKIGKFHDVKIDARKIITDENLGRYGLVFEAPWKWSVDAHTCGLSKEILVIL